MTDLQSRGVSPERVALAALTAAHDVAECTRRLAELRQRMTELSGELASARAQVANLEVALSSNRMIGQAIGIIMARRNLTADQGFEVLRTVGQRTHHKLRDIAEQVVLTGELPAA